MKMTTCKHIMACILGLLLIVLPAAAFAQSDMAKSVAPPISQPIVSEGMLAVSLVTSLGVDSTIDEIVAESRLGDVGIAPANGWIADYPVTPDIIEEVRQSLIQAADDGKLPISTDEALQRYSDTISGLGLTVRPYTAGEAGVSEPVICDNYPNPAMISTVYNTEGPPVVTYYCPPPDHYNLYAWVPYPFWWSEFWFPGFFILRDFHRNVHVHNRFVIITNHFNDVRRHRQFRIDPGDRFHGRSYAGIGARPSRGLISTGVSRSSHTIFNAPRSAAPAASSGINRGSGSRSGAGAAGGGFRQGGGGGSMRGSGGGMRR
jgi:uncharacterized membrane protein YgcG